MDPGVIERPPLRLRNAVRRLRKTRGWSSDELAERARISPRAVRNIEGDPEHNPTATTMLRIAAALGLSLEDVFWSADKEGAA
jgi:DNA-binding XRE family transcriptional regulator